MRKRTRHSGRPLPPCPTATRSYSGSCSPTPRRPTKRSPLPPACRWGASDPFGGDALPSSVSIASSANRRQAQLISSECANNSEATFERSSYTLAVGGSKDLIVGGSKMSLPRLPGQVGCDDQASIACGSTDRPNSTGFSLSRRLGQVRQWTKTSRPPPPGHD